MTHYTLSIIVWRNWTPQNFHCLLLLSKGRCTFKFNGNTFWNGVILILWHHFLLPSTDKRQPIKATCPEITFMKN